MVLAELKFQRKKLQVRTYRVLIDMHIELMLLLKSEESGLDKKALGESKVAEEAGLSMLPPSP